MSRNPIENRPSTAQWLIHAREAAGFTNANAFLAAVKLAEGSAPSYSSYAQWESGEVTPRSKSLAPIRRFHEKRKDAPRLGDQAPTLVTALVALTEELAAWRTERQSMRNELDALKALVQRLGGAALPELAPEGQAVPDAPRRRAG